MTAVATALRGAVDARREDGESGFTVAATFLVDPDEPVFAGHYPGFPILPGVCLVECVHRSVLAAADPVREDPVLTEMTSTKFRRPAYPGDVLDIAVTVHVDGDRWRAEGTIRHLDQTLASVRLAYRAAGS